MGGVGNSTEALFAISIRLETHMGCERCIFVYFCRPENCGTCATRYRLADGLTPHGMEGKEGGDVVVGNCVVDFGSSLFSLLRVGDDASEALRANRGSQSVRTQSFSSAALVALALCVRGSMRAQRIFQSRK